MSGYEFLKFLQIVNFNHVLNLKQYFFYKTNGNLSLLFSLFISIDFLCLIFWGLLVGPTK